MADLGTLLRDNVFVQAVARAHPQWGMSLPAGVLLKVEENDEGITWTLHHRWQGAVVLRCFREYRTSPYRHKVGRILGAGLSPNQQEQLRVLTSRIEATASSRWILIPAVDAFHEWATGLIAFLEEELDWGYFEHGLTDRIVTDLMWMIGDLPEGVSIWDKLTSIETRLSQPERAISAGQDLVG
jgi:hypothetical protein